MKKTLKKINDTICENVNNFVSMIKILILFLHFSSGKFFDVDLDAALAVENKTAESVIFIAGVSEREITIGYDLPVLNESFKFSENCKNFQIQNNTLNTKLVNKNFVDSFNRKFSSLLGRNMDFEEKEIEVANYGFDYKHYPSKYFQKDTVDIFRLTTRRTIEPTNIEINRLTVNSQKQSLDRLFNADKFFSYPGAKFKFSCSKLYHEVNINLIEKFEAIAVIARHMSDTIYLPNNFKFIRLQIYDDKNNLIKTCDKYQEYGTIAKFRTWMFTGCNYSIKEARVKLVYNLYKPGFCRAFSMSAIVIFPPDPNRISRSKRQILAAAGALAGYGAYSVVSKIESLFHGPNEDIGKIKKEINLNAHHEHNLEVELNKLEEKVILTDQSSNELFHLIEKDYCQNELLEETRHIDVYLNNVVDKYINSIEAIITGAENFERENIIFRTMEIVCAHRNIKLRDYCLPYYIKGNFEIESLTANLSAVNKRVIFQIRAKVPYFKYFDSTIHQIYAVPRPLWEKGGYFYFKAIENIPKTFAFFKDFNRRLSLSDCNKVESVHFCDLEKINQFYISSEVCLNSIFHKKSECTYNLIKSSTNCLLMNADHFLLVSHIGNIVLTHSQDYSALDQVHFFHDQIGNLKSNNVTFVELGGNVNLRCRGSTFNIQKSEKAQIFWEYRSLVSNNNNYLSLEPEIISFFENNTEIEAKISQLDKNLHSEEISRLNKLKELNSNKVVYPFVPEKLTKEFSIYSKIAIISALTLIFIIFVIMSICLCKNKCKKKESKFTRGTRDRLTVMEASI